MTSTIYFTDWNAGIAKNNQDSVKSPSSPIYLPPSKGGTVHSRAPQKEREDKGKEPDKYSFETELRTNPTQKE